MVWPSRFWQPHVPPGMGAPRHPATVAVPDRTNGYSPLGLWRDLESLTSFASRAGVEVAPGLTIAVLAWPGDGAPGPASESGGPEPEGWASLGFDVADRSFVSGLVNCGYDTTRRRQLASEWGRHLNAAGLFVGPGPAFAFRDLSDRRVPEHAPFVVFELRLPVSGAA